MPLNALGNWLSSTGWFADEALTAQRSFDPSLDEATASNPNVTLALTGVAATAAVGLLGVALSLGLTGTTAAAATGTAAPKTTVAVTGTASTTSAGTPAPATSVATSGLAASSAVGTLAPARSAPLTGVAGSGSTGTVKPALSVALTGNAATGSTGTVTPSTTGGLTGLQAAGAIGTVTPARAVALTSASATASAGTVTPSSSAALSGLAASGSVGTVTHASSVVPSDIIHLSASVSTPILLSATSTSACPYRARVIRDGAIFYMRLGEAGAPYVDLIHGTQGNARGFVTPGQPGAIADGDAAVGFDNIDQPIDEQGFGDHSRIEVPPNPTLAALSGTQAYSQELWFRYGDSPASGAFALTWRDPANPITGDNIPAFVEPAYATLSRISVEFFGPSLGGPDPGFWYLEWDFGFPDTPVALFNSNDAGDAPLFVFDATEWTQVVTTFDGAERTASLFLNGQFVAALPPSTGPVSDLIGTDGCLHIGADFGFNASQGWSGWIDDLLIYNRVLTPDEVAAHYADRLQRPVIALAASVSTPILLTGSTV